MLKKYNKAVIIRIFYTYYLYNLSMTISEINKTEYIQVNSPGTPACLNIRNAILQAMGLANREQDLPDLIKSACAGCGEQDAIIFDQKRTEIWVRRNSQCSQG